MASKFIIQNHSDLSDLDAIEMVMKVIKDGRISNDGKQYCYGTVFTKSNDGKKFAVWTHLNKKSDRFIIERQEHLE